MPTGYCADYCFYEAYKEFIDLARQQPDTITLAAFVDALPGILKRVSSRL